MVVPLSAPDKPGGGEYRADAQLLPAAPGPGLAVETRENWMEANRYINMDDLREHKKLALRQAA
jgi:hypothetical protein